MTAIYDLVKGNELFAANDDQNVLDVVRAMVERNIGAVPVLHGGELVGLFSERDLMKRVVAEGRNAATTRIGEVMSTTLHVVEPRESLENCMLLMKQHNIRHLPICEGRRLKGMASLRDILLYNLVEKDGEVNFMRAYIQAST
ncbi:MAG: CBS domain-containing protein [Terriglobales bacterium]